MYFSMEDLLKLGLAILVGGLIGFEREYRDKAAGFRTNILIAVGATLFTIFSLRVGHEVNPTRIAANIVTGIGFLGAGTIIREEGKISGLTTAATIWLTAALGMGIGAGEYAVTLLATTGILIVLWLFPFLEHWIDRIHHTATYEVSFIINDEKWEQLNRYLETSQLIVAGQKKQKMDGAYLCSWKVIGKPRYHQHFLERLIDDPEIMTVRY